MASGGPFRRHSAEARAQQHRERRHSGEALAAHPGPCLVAAVGHDAHTSRVLRTSIDLAERLHAFLHVVHVIDSADYPIDPDSARWEERAQEELRRREAQVRDEVGDSETSWSYASLHGSAPVVLRELAEAHQPLMVIVGAGAPGLGGAVERFTFGSPGSSLIHHCPRPVLVVPPAPAPHAGGHQQTKR